MHNNEAFKIIESENQQLKKQKQWLQTLNKLNAQKLIQEESKFLVEEQKHKVEIQRLQKSHQDQIQKVTMEHSQLRNEIYKMNNQFKSTQGREEDFKQKTEEFTRSVRKNNRQSIFLKRRNILLRANMGLIDYSGSAPEMSYFSIVDSRFAAQIYKNLPSNYTMENFDQLLQSISSDDILIQHQGLIGMRKLLQITQNPPIQLIIDSGLLPKMMKYAKQTEYPQLQLEAAKALIKIASDTQIYCQSINDNYQLQLLVELLKSPYMDVVRKVVQAIGDIAGGCIKYRNAVINNGGVSNLIAVIEQNINQLGFIQMGARALSNLCKGRPLPQYQSIKQAISLLCDLIAKQLTWDKRITTICCWAIYYNSDRKNNKIQTLIKANLVPKIVSFVTDSHLELVTPSLYILGNVSTGTVSQTDQILKNGGLNQLYQVLFNPKSDIRQYACWVISNITAGSRQQLQQVIENDRLMQKILQLFESDSYKVKEQICSIFSNMTDSGQPFKIFQLYKQTQIFRYYVNLLMCRDEINRPKIQNCLLKVLSVGENIKGNGQNPMVTLMKEHFKPKPTGALQKLIYCEPDPVYEKVSRILRTYLGMHENRD